MHLTVEAKVFCAGCGRMGTALLTLSVVHGLPVTGEVTDVPQGWEHRERKSTDAQMFCHRCKEDVR